MHRCVAKLYRKLYDSLKQIKWSPQKPKTLTGTVCVDEASALALQPPPPHKSRAAPITKQHRCSFQHCIEPRVIFSCAVSLPRAYERSADYLVRARTWGCGTSSPACSYTSRADLWPHKQPKPLEQLLGDPQLALLLLSPRHLVPTPPHPFLLYEKTPGAAEAPDVQTRWLMLLTLCHWSALIVFFCVFFPLPQISRTCLTMMTSSDKCHCHWNNGRWSHQPSPLCVFCSFFPLQLRANRLFSV